MVKTNGALSLWVFVLFAAIGQSEAYVGVQWPLQIILQDINNYVFNLDATIVEGWSAALSGLYDASAQSAVCEQCNGTMSAKLTAKLGKYAYSASSVASAITVYPKTLTSDEYINTLNGGTGLAPVVCAFNATGPTDGGGDSFLCNVLAATDALLVPDTFSSVSGIASVSNTGLGSSLLAGALLTVVSPLTLTQLGSTGAPFRTAVPVVNVNAGVTIRDEDGLTGVSLSTFVLSDSRVISSPPCSQRNASLLLGSPATQIVGGDVVYCGKLNDVILVVSWGGIDGFGGINQTDCSAAVLQNAVTMTIVFPQNFDTTGTAPFAYALFSQSGSLLCAYGIYQSFSPSSENMNWAQLYFAIGFPVVDYTACDPTTYNTWALNTGITYNITACGLKGGSCGMNGGLFYVNNDLQPLDGSLQLAPNNGSAALLGPADPTDPCLWLQVEPTPGVYGDGSQVLAIGVVTRATPVMYSSAKGVNHQAAVSACVSGIQSDIGSLTIFNALSSGTSAVAAGAGVNAFRAPGFIAQRRGMLRVFPVLVSMIEVAFVNVAPLAYAVALAHKGTSTQSVSWFDVDRNGASDYNTIDVFVATDITVMGRADFYALQWVVIVFAVLLSSAFVMYRWHIVPASYSAGYVPQSLAGAPSSEYNVRVRPNNTPYSDALETKYSVGSLGSAGSQGLANADGLPGVQLTPTR